MAKGYLITEEERDLLRSLMERERQQSRNTPNRPAVPVHDPPAPECNVVRSGDEDIPGLLGTYIFSDYCDVYQIIDDRLTQVTNLFRLVHNPRAFSIPANTFFTAHRDKYGRWLADYACCEEVTTGTGTFTGTGTATATGTFTGTGTATGTASATATSTATGTASATATALPTGTATVPPWPPATGTSSVMRTGTGSGAFSGVHIGCCLNLIPEVLYGSWSMIVSPDGSCNCLLPFVLIWVPSRGRWEGSVTMCGGTTMYYLSCEAPFFECGSFKLTAQGWCQDELDFRSPSPCSCNPFFLSFSTTYNAGGPCCEGTAVLTITG